MIFHLRRVEYGRGDTVPDKREYRVREFEQYFGRSPVGSIQEIADVIKEKLHASDFILELYDPISAPDTNERIGYGRHADQKEHGR